MPSPQTVTITAVLDQSATIPGATVIDDDKNNNSAVQGGSVVRRAKVRSMFDNRRGPIRGRADDGASTARFGRRVRGVYQPPKLPQRPTMGLLDQSATLFAPSFQAKFVYPDLLDNSASVFSLSGITQFITVGLVDNSADASNTHTFQNSRNVTVGLIDQSAVATAPTETSFTRAVPLMDQSANTFAPQVNMKVTCGLMDQSATTFAPSAIGQNVAIGDITDNSATVFDATFETAKTVTCALVDQSSTTFTPTINQAQPQTVLLNILSSGATVIDIIIHVPEKGVIRTRGIYDRTVHTQARYVTTIHKKGTFNP